MASSGDNSAGDGKKPDSIVKQTSHTSLAEELDKNPIKYAISKTGQLSTEAHDKDYMELTLRSGNHGELAKQILRQRIEMRAKEFPRWPSDPGNGVRVMWIESRFWYDRERLLPDFDNDWRSYRARYLHSLELDPREPVHVPEYETELINPIRRFYMRSGDWFESKVLSKFTTCKYKSAVYRAYTARAIMAYFGICTAYYYLKYKNQNWETIQGPILERSRPYMGPHHPDFPFKDYRTEPGHFCDFKFSRRSIYNDLRDYEDSSVVL